MLQVVTMNIGGARKLRQPPHDPACLGRDAAHTLAQVIDPTQPTFIALQETGTLTANGDTHTPHDAMAGALGDSYTAHFAPELTSERHPHTRLWGRPAYDGMTSGAEGNGFVTNLSFAAWDWDARAGAAWTVTQISRAAIYSTGNRNTQPRNMMVASVQHPAYGALYVLNTHFGTLTGENRHDPHAPRTLEGEAVRRHQAGEVLRVVGELRQAEIDHDKPARPIILAGDFNAVPSSEAMQDLSAVFTLLPVENPAPEQWTHTGHKILIDHILVSDPRGVLPTARCFIQTPLPFDDLTDHLPVAAVFSG